MQRLNILKNVLDLFKNPMQKLLVKYKRKGSRWRGEIRNFGYIVVLRLHTARRLIFVELVWLVISERFKVLLISDTVKHKFKFMLNLLKLFFCCQSQLGEKEKTLYTDLSHFFFLFLCLFLWIAFVISTFITAKMTLLGFLAMKPTANALELPFDHGYAGFLPWNLSD